MTQTHRQVNIVLFLLLTAILVYSALYGPENVNRPFPSLPAGWGAGETVSTGLSRGFSAMVRFDVDKALQLNTLTIRMFVFVALQWLLRLGIMLTCQRLGHVCPPYLWIPDALFSLGLFLYAFIPLIRAWYVSLQALMAL